VINVPPDATGRIREYEALTVIELGKRLGLSDKKPLPKNGKNISVLQPVSASSKIAHSTKKYVASFVKDGSLESRWQAADSTGEIIIELSPKETFNKVSIFE
jgi:alpha-L-fucosidase